MKKISLLLVLVMLVSLFAFTGCASEPEAAPEDTAAETATEEPLKVALLLSGPANDQGWNAGALEGLNAAKDEYGLEIAYMENVEVAATEAAFRDYAAQGYDLVIGHGFQFGEPAAAVAADFPDVCFMATEANSQAENMASYVLSVQEAEYIMGAVAASMSEAGMLGYIGGVQVPSIVKSAEAFKLGAQSVNPDVTVKITYIDSWTDVDKGKNAAMSMIDEGVDVLAHAANQAGTGALKAAEEKGILAVGNSYDQNSIAPETIMISSTTSMPTVILAAVEKVREGTFGGGLVFLGMADGAVDVSGWNGFEDKMPQEVKDLVEDLKAKIISGELEVPVILEPTE